MQSTNFEISSARQMIFYSFTPEWQEQIQADLDMIRKYEKDEKRSENVENLYWVLLNSHKSTGNYIGQCSFDELLTITKNIPNSYAQNVKHIPSYNVYTEKILSRVLYDISCCKAVQIIPQVNYLIENADRYKENDNVYTFKEDNVKNFIKRFSLFRKCMINELPGCEVTFRINAEREIKSPKPLAAGSVAKTEHQSENTTRKKENKKKNKKHKK